jgi:hypothetical protein
VVYIVESLAEALGTFFYLTGVRNERIPVLPQPRAEGRGVKSGHAVYGPALPQPSETLRPERGSI